MRYLKKDDCYLDTETGFEWSLDSLGHMNWYDAMQRYPSDGEWRMPTLKELLTLVDHELNNPATAIPGMISSYYWSFTTYDDNIDNAGVVNFNYGYIYCNPKSNSRYIRAVRYNSK